MWSFIGRLLKTDLELLQIVAFKSIGILIENQVRISNAIKSHPAGIDGQNHIIAVPPLKFLPRKEFELRHKSIDSNQTSSYLKKLCDVQDRIFSIGHNL